MVAEVDEFMNKINQLTADFEEQRQPVVPMSVGEEGTDAVAALAEAERKIEAAAASKRAAALERTCVLVAGTDGGASPVCAALDARLRELGWAVTVLQADLSSSGAMSRSIAAERDSLESTPVLIMLPEAWYCSAQGVQI